MSNLFQRCVSGRDLSITVLGEIRQQFSRQQIALLLLLYHGKVQGMTHSLDHSLLRDGCDADPTNCIHHQLYHRYAANPGPLTASQRSALSRMIRSLRNRGFVVEHRRSLIGLTEVGVDLAESLLRQRDTLVRSGITPEGMMLPSG